MAVDHEYILVPTARQENFQHPGFSGSDHAMPPRGPLVEASGKADLFSLGILVDKPHRYIAIKASGLLQLVDASPKYKRKAERHDDSCVRAALSVTGTFCSAGRYQALGLNFSDSLQPAHSMRAIVHAKQVIGLAVGRLMLAI